MPVDAPEIKIDPYKSQVPLVQIPQEDLQRAQIYPEQAGYMGKAGSIMGISDGVMKGMLKGLQLKEERKYKTAQAVMNAQDASINDAKKRYEDSLVSKGKDDPGTRAAWDAYSKVVNEAAEQRQQFAVPEKGSKKSKDQTKKGDKEAGDAAQKGGFAAGLKQFFERNPHVIPEIAIIGMKSQVDPNLYGQMTPELTARQAQLQDIKRDETTADIQLGEAQRKQAAQKTYDLYSGLSSDELAALPRGEQQKFQSAKDVLFPPYQTRTTRQYVSPDGQSREWYIPGMEPEGWNAVATGSGSAPKIGTEQDFTNSLLREHGFTQDNAPSMAKKFSHDYWNWKQAMISSGAHEVLQADPVSGKQVAVMVGGSTTRVGKQPNPKDYGLPPDFLTTSFLIAGQEQPAGQQWGMTAPPQQSTGGAPGKMTAPPSATQSAPKTAAPKTTGSGAITPPPTGVKGLRNTGLTSMTVASNTQKVETEKSTRYQKAEDGYKKALEANQKEYAKRLTSLQKAGALNDATRKQQDDWLTKANSDALGQLNSAKDEIGKWYATQVHAVGGSMPGENQVTLKDGRVVTFKDKATADAAKRELGIQ